MKKKHLETDKSQVRWHAEMQVFGCIVAHVLVDFGIQLGD